jgi:hypothetical protein
MMKTIIGAVTLLAVTAAFAPTVGAETTMFGMGIIVGEPTGIGAKLHLDSGNALAFGLAWSLEGDNELHIHTDYLFHNYDLIPVEQGQLPLYFGVGGRIKINEEHHGRGGDDNVGVRFPVGLAYIFEGAPFDVFMEIVPILDLAPDTDFDLNGAIGGRYWF